MSIGTYDNDNDKLALERIGKLVRIGSCSSHIKKTLSLFRENTEWIWFWRSGSRMSSDHLTEGLTEGFDVIGTQIFGLGPEPQYLGLDNGHNNSRMFFPKQRNDL